MPANTIRGLPDAMFHPREEWQTSAEPVTGPARRDIVREAPHHYTSDDDVPDGDPGEPDSSIPQLLRTHQHDWLTNRHPGYSLGYCWMVDYRGHVWEIRGHDINPAANPGARLQDARATRYGHSNANNYTGPILCLVDGSSRVTAVQARSIRLINAENQRRLRREIGNPTHRIHVAPHFEYDYTQCPGVGIVADLYDGNLTPAAEDSSADEYGTTPPPPPPPPPPTPDPIGPLMFHLLAPHPANRIVDSRRTNPRGERFPALVDLRIPFEHPRIPSTAVALKANFAIITPTGAGWFAAWSDGAYPGTSSINFEADTNAIANEITVGLDGSSGFKARSSRGFHLVVDVVGYYV